MLFNMVTALSSVIHCLMKNVITGTLTSDTTKTLCVRIGRTICYVKTICLCSKLTKGHLSKYCEQPGKNITKYLFGFNNL